MVLKAVNTENKEVDEANVSFVTSKSLGYDKLKPPRFVVF